MLDMGYTATVQVLLAFLLGLATNTPFGRFDPHTADQRSIPRLLLEVTLHFWLITATVYAVRNVRISSPLQGVAGFDHFRMNEVRGQTLFAFVFMFNQQHFLAKMLYLTDRLSSRVQSLL